MSMMPMFPGPTEEEKIERREAEKQAEMEFEMTRARIRRMISEELSHDNLQALDDLLSHIAHSQSAASVALWYQGCCHGALGVRELVLGQDNESG